MGEGQDRGPGPRHQEHPDRRGTRPAAGEDPLFHPGRGRHQGGRRRLQEETTLMTPFPPAPFSSGVTPAERALAFSETLVRFPRKGVTVVRGLRPLHVVGCCYL